MNVIMMSLPDFGALPVKCSMENLYGATGTGENVVISALYLVIKRSILKQ